MRFWNMDYYAEDVDHILEADEDGLEPDRDFDGKLRSTIEGSFNAAFKEREFRRGLVEQLNKAFGEKDWEWILVKLAQARYPSAQVESVGGRKESDHGTDVLIKIPGLLPDQVYAIAIQVKDWTGKVDVNVVDQIAKAAHWEEKHDNFAVIDKVVVCVRASRTENEELLDDARVKQHGIRFVFKDDLTELLVEYGMSVVRILP